MLIREALPNWTVQKKALLPVSPASFSPPFPHLRRHTTPHMAEPQLRLSLPVKVEWM